MTDPWAFTKFRAKSIAEDQRIAITGSADDPPQGPLRAPRTHQHADHEAHAASNSQHAPPLKSQISVDLTIKLLTPRPTRAQHCEGPTQHHVRGRLEFLDEPGEEDNARVLSKLQSIQTSPTRSGSPTRLSPTTDYVIASSSMKTSVEIQQSCDVVPRFQIPAVGISDAQGSRSPTPFYDLTTTTGCTFFKTIQATYHAWFLKGKKTR